MLYGLGACLSLISCFGTTLDKTDAVRNATFVLKRQVIIQRGTWPVASTIYIHDGTSWLSFSVGPTQTDTVITKSPSMSSYISYIVGGYVSNVTVPAVNGAYVEGSIPQKTLNMAYAPSYAATNSGPITQLQAIADPITYTYRYSNSVVAGNTEFIQSPPVYIKYTGGSEGGGVIIDNGNLPDYDSDGIPDYEDPDDDNDGRPDYDDDFPKNPAEKDDSDGDGTGDVADLDDDNDGWNDDVDDAPYDPGTHEIDSDGDGVPNHADAFPNNPRESGDSDGDGVGNNQDPDDMTPPGGGNQGDGDGDPGTGDGGGNPGPVPKPTDGGTDTGTAGVGSTSGAVIPGAAHDVAGAGSGIGGIIPGKIGTFNPAGNASIAKVTSFSTTLGFGKWGSHPLNIDFGNQPWPTLRALMFSILVYHVACSMIKFLKI